MHGEIADSANKGIERSSSVCVNRYIEMNDTNYENEARSINLVIHPHPKWDAFCLLPRLIALPPPYLIKSILLRCTLDPEINS
jgi:hypothetical protein